MRLTPHTVRLSCHQTLPSTRHTQVILVCNATPHACTHAATAIATGFPCQPPTCQRNTYHHI
eukprot:m.472994 g.472994  ORF g.472994 m.472994 type:complete len:62 (-) comp33609_c0_seq1:213-398(-)